MTLLKPSASLASSDDDDAINAADAIGPWVESAVAAATNKDLLSRQLASIESSDALLQFLHRFVLFNDALAARVPFLAGRIHLTPDLFLDFEADEAFCRQANGRVAAFVAEAANDEYRMVGGHIQVHQYLSQRFFRGVLAHLDVDGMAFNRKFLLPSTQSALLSEARTAFLERQAPDQILAALGFHVGLEFFANEEFNLVNSYLRAKHAGLVTALERDNGDETAYAWLAIHTVVEIGHYRAGLQALNAAVKYYHPRADAPRAAMYIRDGFVAFIDLQKRYYEAILRDVG